MNIYSKNRDLNSTVKLVIEEQRKEDINRDLNATIKQMISEPSNLEVTWAAFGDGVSFNEKAARDTLGNSKYYELINNIELDIQQCIASNLKEIDLSTYKLALKGMNEVILNFVLNVLDKGLYKVEGDDPKRDDAFITSHIIFLREMSLLAFDNNHFSLAMELHIRCKNDLYNIVEANKLGPKFIEYRMSEFNKSKADKRWSKHNQTKPEKKKQYLQIMDEQNFTTFTETAEYIKQNIETGKKPSYDSIKRWLSEASKGNCS